jgi:hypothetical protein
VGLRIQQANPLKVVERESFSTEFSVVLSGFKDSKTEYTGIEITRIDLKASAFRKATDFSFPLSTSLAANPTVSWRIQNSREAQELTYGVAYPVSPSDIATVIQPQMDTTITSGKLFAPSADSPVRTPWVAARGIDDALVQLVVQNAERVFFMPGSVSIQVRYAKKRRISNG